MLILYIPDYAYSVYSGLCLFCIFRIMLILYIPDYAYTVYSGLCLYCIFRIMLNLYIPDNTQLYTALKNMVKRLFAALRLI